MHEMCQIWYKFVDMVDKDQSIIMRETFNLDDDFRAKVFIDSILEDDAIVLSLEPFTTTVNIDTIAEIYKEFPWIKPYEVTVPLEDSNGNIRYVNTRRTLVVGKIYAYTLQQYAT